MYCCAFGLTSSRCCTGHNRTGHNRQATCCAHLPGPTRNCSQIGPFQARVCAPPRVASPRTPCYRPAAGQGDKAEVEYKKLIANPGLEDPALPRTTLAHLGLARAYAMENKSAESRGEYEKFFALWKDADTDVPVLEQARLEYAHLR